LVELDMTVNETMSTMSVTSRSTNQLRRWPYKNHDIHSRNLF